MEAIGVISFSVLCLEHLVEGRSLVGLERQLEDPSHCCQSQHSRVAAQIMVFSVFRLLQY